MLLVDWDAIISQQPRWLRTWCQVLFWHLPHDYKKPWQAVLDLDFIVRIKNQTLLPNFTVSTSLMPPVTADGSKMAIIFQSRTCSHCQLMHNGKLLLNRPIRFFIKAGSLLRSFMDFYMLSCHCKVYSLCLTMPHLYVYIQYMTSCSLVGSWTNKQMTFMKFYKIITM